MRIRIFALTLLVAGGFFGPAMATLPTPEQSIETGTTAVVLPRTVGAAIVTRRCSDCPALTLRLTERSRLYVGKEQVTLAQLLKFTDALKADRRLTLFYENKSHNITRLIVAGALR